MESVIYLDTHLVAWLFAGRTDLIPANVAKRIDTHELFVSPMVNLELQYLHEIGRISEASPIVLNGLAANLGLKVCNLAFSSVIGEAVSFNWTRDPFDRIIVAQASVRKAQLLTKDYTILENFEDAVWD
jgi:PIN domain nuclease of toxin-antitoxin system